MTKLQYTVPIIECEVIESEKDQPKKAIVRGTCLKETISRNNNKYTISNIQENDGKEVKFFVQEHGTLELKNVVGKAKLTASEGLLNYEATIRNTKEHPEIVEHAMNNEIDVSIDARAKGKYFDNKTKAYTFESVDVRGICGVGIGGVKENNMEVVLAESFREDEADDNAEVNNLAEDEKTETLVRENETLKQKVVEMEKFIEQQKVSEKEQLVAKIMEVNSDLTKADLMEKEMSTLQTVFEYEKKISENEDEEDKPEETDEEGEGEVGEREQKKQDDDIVVEAEKDFITFSDEGYKKFSDEISGRI